MKRTNQLLPGGRPRYVRCYDNGGKSLDRYTVVFTGRYEKREAYSRQSWFSYLGMSANPFHPQGFGISDSSPNKPIDTNKWGFAPAIGRKNHLGVRIQFADLPPDCRKLVLQDYTELWNLLPAA